MLSRQQIRDWVGKPGNNFCAMPFGHMAIEANGDIRPCCMGDKFKNDDGTFLNIRGKTIQEVYNDPIRQDFIESFRQNKQHKLCRICWEEPEQRKH